MLIATVLHMIRSTVVFIGFLLISSASSSDYRASVIARAKVWQPTDVSAMDLKAGPDTPKAFALGEPVTCTYVKEKLSGKTPKFACTTDDNDHLKVKYGGDNGEVYAEVLGTRLLWALGFGADRMYSVRVVCRDCPSRSTASFEARRKACSIPPPSSARCPAKLSSPTMAGRGRNSISWTRRRAAPRAQNATL
jgi:hypothetical protein